MEKLIDKKVLNELYEIINHLSPILQRKIPETFMDFIEKNRDEEYIFEFEESKPINEQHMQKDTEILLSLIYKDYICNEEEKKKIDKIWQSNEEDYQKKLNERYSAEKIFNNQKIDKNDDENSTELIESKDTLWKEIIRKIKSFFIK